MRKIVLTISILTSFTSFSQFHQGASFLEGGLDFLSEKTTLPDDSDSKTTGFGLTFGIGSFVSDNAAVGAGLSYSKFKAGDLESNLGGANIFFQNFKKITENLYFTPRINADYSAGKSDVDFGFGSPREIKLSRIRLSWVPGIQYALNEKWTLGAVFGSISYVSTKEKDETSSNEITTSSFEVSMAANFFNVGIQYYLDKK